MGSMELSRRRELSGVSGAEMVPGLAVEDLTAAWDQYLSTELSEATQRAYKKGLKQFSEWLTSEGLTLARVRPSHVRLWRESLAEQYSAQSVNLWLSAVRQFYNFLVTEYDAPIMNPATPVKGASRRGNARRHKRDELTADEIRAVLASCDDGGLGRRDRAILSLMAYCALRTVEVQRADLKDLQTKDGRKVLWVRGKGHTEADDFVVLPQPVEAAMRSWMAIRGKKKGPLFLSMSNQNRDERLSTRAIRGMVKSRYQAAGVVGDGKTSHSLRHSAITSALRAGASPLQVQAMARHKSFSTTQSYVHELGRIENPAEDLIQY